MADEVVEVLANLVLSVACTVGYEHRQPIEHS